MYELICLTYTLFDVYYNPVSNTIPQLKNLLHWLFEVMVCPHITKLKGICLILCSHSQSKPLQRSSTIWLKEDSSSQRCPTPVSLCCIVSHDLIIWNALPAYMIPDTRFWMSYIHIPLTLRRQIHVENNNTILSSAWVVKWFVGGLSIAKIIIIM